MEEGWDKYYESDFSSRFDHNGRFELRSVVSRNSEFDSGTKLICSFSTDDIQHKKSLLFRSLAQEVVFLNDLITYFVKIRIDDLL